MTDTDPTSTNPGIGRRRVLGGGLALGGAVALGGLPAPAWGASLVRGDRPRLTSGVQSGDVTGGRATVWGRADRTSRMVVELSRDPAFRRPYRVHGPVVTAGTDFTGRIPLRGLPAGTRVHYRVRFADPDTGALGPAEPGSFRTADPSGRSGVRLVWAGDLAGQGWGINPAFGGYRVFDAMRACRPDVFLFSGDTVYADGPLQETVALPDGSTWHNLVTPAKEKVAETLEEFRGQWRYNLLDEGYRRFNAEVPVVAQWDDHEVTNNWYPGEILEDDRYTEKRVDVLARRARRGFGEYFPIGSTVRPGGRIYRSLSYGPLLDVFVVDMRTFKDPNTSNDERRADGGVFGWEQLQWLEREVRRSRATWKVIAADLPIGLLVPDGAQAWEGIAQGNPDHPLGRELEVAWLLRQWHRAGVKGTVWLTADVHYTAAHHYDPARASFQDFSPFWEFVSGPLNAGAFGPNALDPTFGPEAVYVEAPPAPNTSPAEGYQFFGEVDLAAGGAMTVRLRGIDGSVRFETELLPEG